MFSQIIKQKDAEIALLKLELDEYKKKNTNWILADKKSPPETINDCKNTYSEKVFVEILWDDNYIAYDVGFMKDGEWNCNINKKDGSFLCRVIRWMNIPK